MAEQKLKSTSQLEARREGITRITVAGFKSISQEQSIEIRPLTILAGANSSGKSSIMQPLLLLKQTLEAPYDPGALLLNGPNVHFTSADQILSRVNDEKTVDTFHVGIEAGAEATVMLYFIQGQNKGFDIKLLTYNSGKEKYRLYMDMPESEIQTIISTAFSINTGVSLATPGLLQSSIGLVRNRCFLVPTIQFGGTFSTIAPLHSEAIVGYYVRQMLHLPGLRGNPERNYPVTAGSIGFSGTFEYYTASVILQWQMDRKQDTLEKLSHDLIRLGLARKVSARAIDAASIELLVNRLTSSNENSTEDMVSIADVGLGVSQALPVIVALHAADEGQLIYLEQPEIHLHPRAQYAMAEVLADAALQGKRLVVETHSSLLLLGIQTLVAEGKLPPEMVKLHWFKQQEDGSTRIISADLDEAGAYGDWPEDFDKVILNSESRYIDAAEARSRGE